MIDTMIFDLDGTLVQTEKLKALSYAKASVELCPYTVSEDEVLEAFKDVVGLSRQEVAEQLIERFDLTDKAEKRMAEFGVDTVWEAFVQVRLRYYNDMMDDPAMIRDNQWAHNVNVLEQARAHGCKTALATMSHREQVTRVLDILDFTDKFDVVATCDDVEHGKPNPEIYNLVLDKLDSKPENTIVLEDSPSGVRAGLNAGVHVIAVSTPFTREGLHQVEGLDSQWIVDDPDKVLDVVNKALEQYG